jgi:flagellar biosynthesis protein FlhA
MNDLTIQESLRTYTLLSVGDGLVTQIPALIVSTASGIIVTRAAATSDMGHDISQQLTFQPRAIMVASGVIFVFGIVPGLPTLPFVALGTILGMIAYAIDHKQKQDKEEAAREERESKEEAPPPERTEDMLKLDTLEVEIGYGLIPLVDANQGGDLLDRVAVIRKQLALEMGLIVPAIRIRDNVQLQPNEYAIKIKGLKVAVGELMPDHVMAINPGYIEDEVDGFETVEPAFQLKARWVIPNLKETAEAKGYTVVEPTAVLATHLTEVIRGNAAEIVSRQDVQRLLDNLKEDQPALVDGVVPELLPLALIHKVLQLLLSERVPIRDLSTIMETLSDYVASTTDPEVLAEYCRMALRRQITDLLKEDNKLHVFTLSPSVEQALSDSLQNTKQGMMLVLPPQVTDKIIASTQKQADILATGGHQAICLTSPNVRLAFRRLLEAALPQLIVISYNEVHPDVEVISTGMVEIDNDN